MYNSVNKVAWKAKSDEYIQEIEWIKMRKWKEYVNNVDDKIIWQIKKYIINIFTSTFISIFNDHITTYEQKINAFQKFFFFESSSANLTNIFTAVYLQKITYKEQITIWQI